MAFQDDETDDVRDSSRTARGCIVEAAWKVARTEEVARALALPGQKVAIMTVPDLTWVRPVAARLGDLMGEGWVAIERDVKPRVREAGDLGDRDLVAHLARGKNVVGIAPSAAILPRALLASADLTIAVERPDERVMCEAIRSFLDLGKLPKHAAAAGSLDLHCLAACFRPGSARAIVERIARAAARGGGATFEGGRVPDLSTAVEFGAAREWGLAVARDVKLYQTGGLPWSSVIDGGAAILHSAPGLGKTTYAASLARHMGATLILTSISELFASSPGYLDSVIKQLRESYQRAEANVPTILMFDEVDALPSRVGLDSRSASWWTSLITEFMLLVAAPHPGVVQLAATNFLDRVDPALLRPGRFGRTIELVRPDAAGIESMTRFQLAGELASVDLSDFCGLAAGATAADIMSIVKRARAIARDAGRDLIADDLVAAAAPKSDAPPDDMRRITIHEAGHAVAGLVLDVDDLVSVRAGNGIDGELGATLHRRRGRLDTRATMEDRAVVTLAGRAAELVCLAGEMGSGSGGDLVSATESIVAVHGLLGLGDNLAVFDTDDVRVDRELRAVVESEMRRLQVRAIALVRTHRAAVEAVATALAERRLLTGAAARAIFAAHPPTPRLVPVTPEVPEC